MNIVTREEIGLAKPKYRTALRYDGNGWFWHWLGVAYPEQMSEKQMILSAQRYHMASKGWSDIAYNFAVGRSGTVYELRGWDVAGGATRGFNNSSHALLFLIGQGQQPTMAQFVSAWELVAQRPGVVRSHRDVGNTQCPGDEIAFEVKQPSFQELSMTFSEAEALVKLAYKNILDREGDAGGVKFWADQLVNKDWTVEDMRWEFLKTRLAANSVQYRALADSLSHRQATNAPTAEEVARQAYDLFLENLTKLRS